MNTKEIDFKVERKELFTECGIKVLRQALVRADTREVLGVVSPDYKVVTHKEALDKTLSVVEQFEDLRFHSLQTTKGGARMYAKFESEKEYLIGRTDKNEPDNIKLNLILTNSYDGLLRYGFIIGAYRLVCKNGLRVGKDLFAVRRKHTAGLNIDNIMYQARKAVRYFNDTVLPNWKNMSNKRVIVEKALEELKDKVSHTLHKDVSERLTGKREMTMWDLYNEFTWTLSHEEKYQKSLERNEHKHRKLARAFESLAVA